MSHTTSRRTIIRGLSTAAVLAPLAGSLNAQEDSMNPFEELFQISQAEKKGLTFYVGGQTIPGIVIKIHSDAGTVEVRNQTHSRILIRLDRVDAVAAS